MRLGLCGAHRTGKSTLARAVAPILNATMVASSVSQTAKEFQFDMDRDRRDVPKFFAMQVAILDRMAAALKHGAWEGNGRIVSDRTPLDAAAYLVADMQANTGSPKFQDEVLRYVDRACRLTEELFDVVILVPPAITFEPMDGKPGGNIAYQEHHHLICRGLHADLEIPAGVIERDNLDLTDRADAVVQFVKNLEGRGLKEVA